MFSNEHMPEVEPLEWTLTNAEHFRCQRSIVDPEQPLVECYEMCQAIKIGDEYRVCHGVVAIGAVPEDELDVLVRMYGYAGLEDFVQQTSPTNEFVFNDDGTIDRENSPAWILEYALLAEMDFETNALAEYMTDHAFAIEGDAFRYIFEKFLRKRPAEEEKSEC